MSAARVTMIMHMRMTGVDVIVVVGMGGHADYSTRSMHASQPAPLLSGQFDTPLPRMD